MSWFNQVQALRRSIGLSQRDLASRARTSQQQVQRIESGVQAPRIGLALRLAQALGQPLEQVFPLPAPQPLPAPTPTCVDEAGLRWSLMFRMQGGMAGRVPVACAEVGRLREAIEAPAAPAGRFIVFPSAHHEVALRLDRLCLAKLQSSPLLDQAAERDFPPNQAVIVLRGDPAPAIFPPEPDEAAIEATEEKEDAGPCRNQSLIATLDLGAFHPLSRFGVVDARSGETVHILARDLALLAMPFDALSPGCLPPPRRADNDA
jgi:transcriptional regulator with XRE-family HTH domain